MSKMTAAQVKKLASATKACLSAKSKVAWKDGQDYQSRSYWIAYKQYVITRITMSDVALESRFAKEVDDTREAFVENDELTHQMDTYLTQATTKSMDGLVADAKLLRVALRFYEAAGVNVDFVGYTDFCLRLHGSGNGVTIDTAIATIKE